MADETTKHAGWMPANPSMDQGGALAPDSDALSGGAAGTDIVSNSGQRMGTPSMADSGGVIETRIMEEGIEYEWPGSDQGSLEPPRGGKVRGA